MLILFPDDHHVKAADNVRYQQASIAPSEGLLTPEFPWEGHRVNLYGSVLKTASGYEMFYQCHYAQRIGYAVSDDGFHWTRPLLNRTNLNAPAQAILQGNDQIGPIPGSDVGDDADETLPLTNLVAGFHMPSVIYEPDQEPPYKMFAFGEGGYHVLQSPTGQRFNEYPGNPVIPQLLYQNTHTNKVWVSDVAPCFKDRSGYTAMVKTYHIDDEHRTLRCVGKATSKDFEHWSETRTLWIPGEAEHAIARARGFSWADFYGLCPFAWGNGYLGLLWLFEIDRELPHGTNKGKMEVFLAYSADGKQWRRLSDQPLIPWDLNFGADGGMVTTASAPVFEDDEIRLYYSDSNFEHGVGEKDLPMRMEAPTWKIRCARVPRERLVGATAEQGSLRLAGVRIQARRIRLNVACLGGRLNLDYRVDGQSLATQSVADVDESDLWLETPVGGDVELLISLENATLYALEVI